MARNTWRQMLWRWEERIRFRLGGWVLGGGWNGVLARQTLIVERARRCITRDGGVILADCAALAEALYDDVPGVWQFTITRISSAPTSGAPTE